jgi:sulfite reductase (NADPH) flavoprotein alpha-component
MISTLPPAPAGFDEATLQKLGLEHSIDQQIWLSGYLYGLAMARRQGGDLSAPDAAPLAAAAPAPVAVPAGPEKIAVDKVRILFGSHTGNSKKVSNQTAEMLRAAGWEVVVSDMNDYPVKNLKDEKYVLAVVSTQGEGDPPTAAEEFYRWLHGPRAAKLNGVKFAVCGLGDKSYLNFCQTGKDFDKQFEALGASRLAGRADCDTDYEQAAENWAKSVVAALGVAKPAAAAPSANGHSNGASVQASAAAQSAAVAAPASKFNRKNPFEAPVFEKIQLNGRGSAKETWHLELSLQDSGLIYEPGDALGIFASNSDRLVEQVLKATKLNASESVEYDGEYWPLGRVLKEKVELTVLTRDVIEAFAKKTQEPKLFNLLKDNAALKDFLWGRNVLDLLTGFPMLLGAQQLVGALRKMPPRLYSIASSLEAHPEEVHLTVAAVRYDFNNSPREGVGSTFLADRIEIGDNVPVFIERNEYFKLPARDDADVIMVGPGTGVAPFRAFVAERSERGASGRNWLFFGNPHFTTDFLYQAEWLQHLKNGTLDRLDVAFSNVPNCCSNASKTVRISTSVAIKTAWRTMCRRR